MREELSTIILILRSPSSSSAAALSYSSPGGTMEMQSDEMNCPGSSFAEQGTELDLGLCDQQCQARALRSPTEGWPWINYHRLWHQYAMGPGTHCLSSLRCHFPICKKRVGPPPRWPLAAEHSASLWGHPGGTQNVREADAPWTVLSTLLVLPHFFPSKLN